MIAVRNVILSGMTGPQTGAIATAAFTTPEIRADAAKEVLYKFTYEHTSGTMSTARLKVAFQAAIRTTAGQASTDNFTDKSPVWQTLNADQHAGLLPDGDWPTVIADLSETPPVTFYRRIVGGFSNRLLVTPFYSGGTNPAFVMSIEAEVRYA